MHLYTDYKITNKSLADLTIIQYKTIIIITEQISGWKNKNKPQVIIWREIMYDSKIQFLPLREKKNKYKIRGGVI